MGALLAGALVIIPAATGRRLATNITQFLLASSTVSVATVVFGLLTTRFVLPGFSLGPTTAVVGAMLFAMSLFVRHG